MRVKSSFLVLALVAGMLALMTGTASAATLVVDNDGVECPSPDYMTIQAAVDAASPGDTINVCAGTYPENVTINKKLVVEGAGAAVTIVDPPATGPAISVTAGGDSAADRLVISDLTTTGSGGTGNTGTGIRFDGSTTLSHVTLDGVASVLNGGHGVAINHTGTMSDLELTDVDSSDNGGTGFRVPTSLISLDGLSITGSTLERNLMGMEVYIAFSPSSQTVSDVLVEDTSFDANTSKGIYAERLDDATFRRISVVGAGTAGGFAAGIDINLKFRSYQNITIEDSEITDNGAGDPVNGVGVTVKARDDVGHPQYGVLPATLTNVTLEGNTVARNTSDGIRLGEPARNNAGPTSVHVNFNNIETNTGQGIDNQSQALTDGTCNWWGSASGPGPVGPGTGDEVSTNVDYEPWLTAPAPGGPCNGPIVTPPSSAACKKNGWMAYTDDTGRPFKNQGDCQSYFATGGKNKAAG